MNAPVSPLLPGSWGINPKTLELPQAFLETAFCSGQGQYHSPNAKHPRPLETVTGAKILEMLLDPQQVDKEDARWVIFSDRLSRVAEDQRQHGGYFALWCDLDHEPPELKSTVETLAVDLGCAVLGYTSRSATEYVPKARLVVPLASPCPGHRIKACQRFLNDRLEAMGITPDRATERANQLCYLPNRGDYYAATASKDILAPGGLDWADRFAADLTTFDRAEAERREAQTQRRAEAHARMAERLASGQLSEIDAFNEAHPLEEVLGWYCEAYGGRWLSPLSESGSPGISLFGDGLKWHSSHASDRDAGLGRASEGGGCWGDAFDLYCHYEHGGDRTAAQKAVGDMITTPDGQTLTEHNRERWREQQVLAILGDLKEGPREFEDIEAEVLALTPDADHQTVSRLAAEAGSLSAVECDKLHRRMASQLKCGLTVIRQAAKEAKQRTSDDHLAHAQRVIVTEGAENLLATRGAVWRWSASGVWVQQEDRTIKQRVQAVLAASGMSVSRSAVDSVTDLLKNEIHTANHRFDVGAPETINCINGELVNTPQGWRLEPHQREHYWTAQIPVAYDPAARAPRFEHFLREVFEGDPDSDDKRRAVLEMMGYSLVAHCRFERFILMVGNGANGKSVLLRIVEALVGADRAAGVQPSKFGSPFQRARLEGKLVNLISEIKQGEVVDDASLKGIVSGEASTVEHKNRDPFELRPYATCWFATNHMPHTRDHSDGFFRRALVVKLNRTFRREDGTADSDLEAKLKAELPGILNLAVEAYAEALQVGYMTMPPSSVQAARQWRLDADQAAQFLDEECLKDADSRVSVAELYSAYKRWVDENGITHKLSRRKLGDRLEVLGFTRGRGAKGVRGVYGLRLRLRRTGVGLYSVDDFADEG
ncbi:DNA primase family protein [Onishia taeanensis]